MAMLMSFMGLSSAATRLELSAPQRLQRCMTAHSPPLRTQDRYRLHDAAAVALPVARLYVNMQAGQGQLGQWLRWPLPAFSGVHSRPQTLQVNASLHA